MMDRRILKMSFLTVLLACCSVLLSYAQPSVKTTADHNEILIGEQFNIKVEATFDANIYKLRWLNIPDSIQHFEVVNRSKIDSVANGENINVSQTITLTSFDSGKWLLPSFIVGFDTVKNDGQSNFFTDSVPITVSFSAADSTNQLRDIKPIRQVEVTNMLWYWIAGGVLLLIIIILLIWKLRKKKKPVEAPVFTKSKLSAYDEAMASLKELSKYDLTNAAQQKEMHSKLGEIVKRYLSRRENTDLHSYTTSDLLQFIRGLNIDSTLFASLASVLRIGDAVKFAKYAPPANESEECIADTGKLIESFNKNNA